MSPDGLLFWATTNGTFIHRHKRVSFPASVRNNNHCFPVDVEADISGAAHRSRERSPSFPPCKGYHLLLKRPEILGARVRDSLF